MNSYIFKRWNTQLWKFSIFRWKYSLWFLCYCWNHEKPLNLRPCSRPAQFGVFKFFSFFIIFYFTKKWNMQLKNYTMKTCIPSICIQQLTVSHICLIFSPYARAHTHTHTFNFSMLFQRMTFYYIPSITFSSLRVLNNFMVLVHI